MGKMQSSTSDSCDELTVNLANVEGLQLEDNRIYAFLNCCKKEAQNRGRIGEFSPGLDALPDPNDAYDHQVRSFFPETWIFDEIEIE